MSIITSASGRGRMSMSAAKAAQLGRSTPARSAADTATPAVRTLAASRGVDLNRVVPTGVGNRITTRDVLAAAAPAPIPAASAQPDLYTAAWGDDTDPTPAPHVRSERRPAASSVSADALYDLAWPGNDPSLPGVDSFPVATGGN